MTQTGQSAYPHMFSPIRIGPIELRNRLVLSAMTTGFGFEEGRPTPDILAYFQRRSAGVGMAVVAFGAVAPEGRVERQIPWMWNTDTDEAMGPLAEAISYQGAVPCLQLGHGGRQVSPRVTGQTPVGPSAVAPDVHVKDPPRELTTPEVEAIVTAFGAAAQRAASAGFGAIELHGAHGYLVHQFLSASANQRTDRYGGVTLFDRARFGIEVIEAIQAGAPDLALTVRLNGEDLIPGGMTSQDAGVVASLFEAAGCDAIVVSGGVYGSVPYTIPLLNDSEATFLAAAEVVRRHVSIPVVAVGRITRPETAEDAIATGQCDAVAIGRALLSDPDWVVKAAEGRTGDIRPCIATVQGCAGMLQHGEAISCSVNPELGRERRTHLRTDSRHLRLVVIGAGPAGMEAAIAATERGHTATLIERDSGVGGALRTAAATPPLRHLEQLIGWYERRLSQLGVDLRLSTEASVDLIDALEPDGVVVATGAATEIPTLEGYDLLPAWRLEDAIAGLASTLDSTGLPENVVVIGGGQRALAGALWAAEQGSSVSLLAKGRTGEDTSGLARRALLQRLDSAGVKLCKGQAIAIVSGGIQCEFESGERGLLPGDGVLLADPLRPSIPAAVGALNWQAVRIGDCKLPRGIAAAVVEGQEALDALA
jgi:2,4-dienoyl-CoA reductase-like NADH-dependent reductase (Old Yellow Enzyme family)/thioredoxin reductase